MTLSSPELTTAEVLDRAKTLTSGDRAEQHGDKLDNHQNIADLWSAYLGQMVTPHDVAICMVLLKIARTKSGKFNDDDYVDMVGYGAIAGELYAQGRSLDPKVK